MIYLITGVPGSGKTLYAVSTLVKQLLAQKLRYRGKDLERRLVVDGVPDLILPHEPMAPLVEDDKGVLSCEGQGLTNWFSWVKPGDVILVDEVQRYWRPRGLGTKPPDMIKHLETHRHLGVDFVVITQNPMLIDQNVRRLVGRHQHVRRILGLSRAVIYDWDGCSVDVHRTKSATMSFWSYPKSAYGLYKSSELHTKQKQKIPAWVVVPVLAVVGGLAVAPTAFSTMSGAMSGRGVSSTKASLNPVAAAVPAPSAVVASPAPSEGLPEPLESVGPLQPMPELAGCVYRADMGCRCYTPSGRRVEADPDACGDLAAPGRPVLSGHLPADNLPARDVLAYLDTAQQRGPIHGVGMGETHGQPAASSLVYQVGGAMPSAGAAGAGRP